MVDALLKTKKVYKNSKNADFYYETDSMVSKSSFTKV
jgi:hypothetical protein